MGHSIAVMNTKGGVGKSTLVMALAETLAAFHSRNVLVIDSDSQTSMSAMLMPMGRWEEMERQKRTLVDLLIDLALESGTANWRDFIASGVSDVEEARSIYLLPSHMELSIFEREVAAQRKGDELRLVARKLLTEIKRVFDIVLIDCPPGLSLLTECWLREVDYFLPPTKPDYLGVRGLEVLKRFREQYADQGFGKLMGTLINLKDGRIVSEVEWQEKLSRDPANRCFSTVIPRRAYIQRAADFDASGRTYIAKYPGDAGVTIRGVTEEVLVRLGELPAQKAAPAKAAGATQGPAMATGTSQGPQWVTAGNPGAQHPGPGQTAAQPMVASAPRRNDRAEAGNFARTPPQAQAPTRRPAGAPQPNLRMAAPVRRPSPTIEPPSPSTPVAPTAPSLGVSAKPQT
jgi:chromosome partitioning protein